MKICGMEWWSKGVMGFGMGEDAGPEAGAPTEAKWKMNCRRGVIGRLARKMVVLNYTYLHAFTRFYTKFLTGVHRRGAETQRGRTWANADGRWVGSGKRRAIRVRSTRLFPRNPALVVVSG